MTIPFPRDSFRGYDESPDASFYRFPRFVEHIDAGAIATVTQLYRDHFPTNAVIAHKISDG